MADYLIQVTGGDKLIQVTGGGGFFLTEYTYPGLIGNPISLNRVAIPPAISGDIEAALTLAYQGNISTSVIGTYTASFLQATNFTQTNLANSIVEAIRTDGATFTFATEVIGDYSAEISISSTLSDVITNIATLGGSFSQEIDVSISSNAGLDLDAAISIALSKSDSFVSDITIEGALSIALTGAITQSVLTTFEPSISIDLSSDIVESVLADVNAALVQSTELDFTTTSNYIVNSAVSLGCEVSVSQNGATLLFRVLTPKKRVLIVLNEDRTINVLKEDRIINILNEDRDIGLN